MIFTAGAHNDGIQPKISGPVVWFYLHMLASSFPNSKKKIEIKSDIKKVFIFTLKSFPCQHCRSKVLVKYIEKKNFYKINRRQVENLIFKLHNYVNKKLKKKMLNSKQIEKKRHFYRSMKTGIFNHRLHSKKCGKVQIKIIPQSKRIKSSITGNKKCLL